RRRMKAKRAFDGCGMFRLLCHQSKDICYLFVVVASFDHKFGGAGAELPLGRQDHPPFPDEYRWNRSRFGRRAHSNRWFQTQPAFIFSRHFLVLSANQRLTLCAGRATRRRRRFPLVTTEAMELLSELLKFFPALVGTYKLFFQFLEPDSLAGNFFTALP